MMLLSIQQQEEAILFYLERMFGLFIKYGVRIRLKSALSSITMRNWQDIASKKKSSILMTSRYRTFVARSRQVAEKN